MFEVVCRALVLLNFHLSFFHVDLSFSLFGMICVLFHNLQLLLDRHCAYVSCCCSMGLLMQKQISKGIRDHLF